MSNVTIAIASASVRPFVWGDPNIGVNYTTTAVPSNGKYKETLYTTFQAILTDTAAGPTATVSIQGTNDALTGAGILLPVLLTNGTNTATIPTSPYNTFNVLDGNSQPTGQRVINSLPYQSFLSVPAPDMWLVNASGPLRGIPDGGNPNYSIPLAAGMVIYGAVGLGAGNLVTAVTQSTVTFTSNFTGTTGIYFITFANNFWANTALGTITLNGGTATYATDGFTSAASAFRFVRANVTALTGTSPQLMVFQGS